MHLVMGVVLINRSLPACLTGWTGRGKRGAQRLPQMTEGGNCTPGSDPSRREPPRPDTLAAAAARLCLCGGLGCPVLLAPCVIVVLRVEEALACGAVHGLVFDDHSVVLELALAPDLVFCLAHVAVWMGDYDEHGGIWFVKFCLVRFVTYLWLPSYIIIIQ